MAKHLNLDQIDHLRAMVRAKCSYRQIGKTLGINEQTAKKLGIRYTAPPPLVFGDKVLTELGDLEVVRLCRMTKLTDIEIVGRVGCKLESVMLIRSRKDWNRKAKFHLVLGQRMTVAGIVEASGCDRQTIHARLRRGLKDDALLAGPHKVVRPHNKNFGTGTGRKKGESLKALAERRQKEIHEENSQ